MKHIMGNSPKCNECKFYREKEEGVVCRGDGFCVIGYNRINGKKYNVERRAVSWNESCQDWVDAENDLIEYCEAVTHKPAPYKTPLEQMLIEAAIRDALAEQMEKRKNDRRANKRIY